MEHLLPAHVRHLHIHPYSIDPPTSVAERKPIDSSILCGAELASAQHVGGAQNLLTSLRDARPLRVEGSLLKLWGLRGGSPNKPSIRPQ